MIYLNEMRKKRAKAAKQTTATTNRARHGRTKLVKEATRREKERDAATLDAKLLDDKSGAEGEPEQV